MILTNFKSMLGRSDTVLLVVAVLSVVAVYAVALGFYRAGHADELVRLIERVEQTDPQAGEQMREMVAGDPLESVVFEDGGNVRNAGFRITVGSGDLRQDARRVASILKTVAEGRAADETAEALRARRSGEVGLVQLATRAESIGSLLGKLFGPEQLTCYILALWGGLILRREWYGLGLEIDEVVSGKRMLQRAGAGQVIEPHVADSLASCILLDESQAERSYFLLSLKRTLERFHTAQEVAAAEAVVSSNADEVLDDYNANTSMVRFATWAIPSVGFIGTVRGIGSALSTADSPEQLSSVVGWLGVAFDTTLIALVLSILLVLLAHGIQRRADEFALRLRRTCQDLVLDRLHVPLTPRGIGK